MGILVAEGAGPVIPDMPLRYNKPPIALPAFFPPSSLSLSLPPPPPPQPINQLPSSSSLPSRSRSRTRITGLLAAAIDALL
jgi:hypothetical protein